MAGVVVLVLRATSDIVEVKVFSSMEKNGVDITVELECSCSVLILSDVVKKLESSCEV